MLAHIPVLLNEVIQYLDPKPNDHVVDVTVGAGGHARAILERTAPHGRLLAIDLDPAALAAARVTLEPLASRVTFIHDSFDHLERILDDAHFPQPACLLADLGLSSLELGDTSRGFSFQLADSPLDMRFDPTPDRVGGGGRTAADILNQEREENLANLIYEYGEERRSRQIAHSIVVARRKQRFVTVGDLLAIFPGRHQSSRRHPATKTFQALRIEVNNELGRLQRFLPQAVTALRPGGRLAVISFHSLEDRIVKNFLREQAKAGALTLLTKHPAAPSFAEVTTNPRSRSAKLRAVVRKPHS